MNPDWCIWAWFIFMFFYAGYYGVRQIIRAVRWWQRAIREHKQRADDEDDMLRRVMAQSSDEPWQFPEAGTVGAGAAGPPVIR